ncbi:putative Ig domain-containing protein [Paludibaculum fermentans]|uniref:putative Ig domain-containing protein n=1 Tax=Paludibaculum fermentans TaxID=1473598 RepID=UPI003EBBEB56
MQRSIWTPMPGALRLLAAFVLGLAVSTASAAPLINFTEIAAVVHANGGSLGLYSTASPEFSSNLDADNFGTLAFHFTNNSGAVYTAARVTIFLDADIDALVNGYSNEYGSVALLLPVTGAPAGSIAADSWEIDEPGFVFGDIYTNLLSGTLDKTNAVPDVSPNDVSLALSFYLGDIPSGGTFSISTLVAGLDLNGLAQTDPVNGLTFYWNGFAQVSGSLGGNPNTPPANPNPPSGVPEPGSLALVALPVIALALWRRKHAGLAVLAAVALVPAMHAQPSAKYTTTEDFLKGSTVNLNLATPGVMQINPPTGTQTFPFLNVAASGKGTIVRIHTTSGQVVGEYRTAPELFPTNPSRTTVDLEGNVWAGNRDANAYGRGSVVKVGLVVGGTRTNAAGVADPVGGYLKPPFLTNTCIDRNRDGLIRTSKGLGDILPWPNVTDAEGGGTALVEDAEDECILIYQTTPGVNTRHVSVDAQNNVWVAGYPYYVLTFAKLDGKTGAILDEFDARTFGCGGYGGVVDKNGILWSSSTTEGRLLRYDPVARTGQCIDIPYAYGLAIAGNGDIWTASYALNLMYRVAPDGTIRNSFPIAVSPSAPTGTAVTPLDGNVWVANRYSDNVSRLDANGRQLKLLQVGVTPTGVAVDAAGKIWVSNYGNSNVMRIDPKGGADGLGAVDLTVDLISPAGTVLEGAAALPYNYSDMTGVIAIGATSPQGVFTVLQDSGEDGTVWSMVEFNTETGASVPAGSSLKVEVRASNNSASFPDFAEVQSGIRFQKTGRYLEVRVTLRASAAGVSPVFTNLNIYGDRKIEDLLSRAKDSAADLQWTPIPQAAGYNIYRGPSMTSLARIRQNFVPAAAAAAIFPDTGLTNATPYYYMVRWVDRAGNESPDSIIPSATGTARTQRGLTSPTILSPPVVRGMQNTPYVYQPQATDPDAGDRLAYMLTVFPTGMTIHPTTGLINWTPQPNQTGPQRVLLRVQDLGGRFASQSFDVQVAALRTNFVPSFTSTPPATGTVGYPITYDANASDANSGDILTFSLLQGPAGLSVRASDGMTLWTPSAAQLGPQTVRLQVSDGQGGSAVQQFTVTIGANRPPSFTSTPVTSGGTGLRYAYAAKAADPDGLPLTFELASGPTGFFIGPQSGIAEWVPQFYQAGAFPVTLRVKDPAGAIASQTFTINVAIANKPPVFTSTPLTTGSATQTYTYSAKATDPEGTAVKYGLNVYPYNMAINAATGVITWTPSVAQTGVHNITVRATDANGLNTFQLYTLTIGASDTTLPTVSLTYPVNGSTLASDVVMKGTASDPNLRQWRVEYRPTGATAWSTLTSGTTSVVNGSLGNLPATLLANNTYRLRLYAEDTGGAQLSPEIEVNVNTNRLKLGAMTMAFDDVRLTNAPLPLVLRRLYDSRQAEPGDFGPGWKLGLAGLDLRLDVNNNAFVTLPDGRRVAFSFAAEYSGFLVYFPKYFPAPGVTDTLEPLDCTGLFFSGGKYYCAFQPDYNPKLWKLTTRAGVAYEFDNLGRMTRISDRSGLEMLFTTSGITTNYGRGVSIHRDGSGRITSIVDAVGNLHRYQYDSQSRLTTYINPRNESTVFSYPGTGHLITSIQTPGNCNPLRVTYDADGRVSSKIDASNNTILFSYDIAARIERQTDALARVTTRHYDTNGNLVELVDPLGNHTLFQYDLNNNNTAMVDPSGRRIERTFDVRGNLQSLTMPAQAGPQTTTYSYTPLDQLAEIRYPLGDRLVYTYDAKGHMLTRQRRSAANVTIAQESWSYNAAGDQTGYTDGEGKTTAYTRNANGELTASTDATGRTTSYTYDLNGNATSRTTPDGETLQLAYDGFNFLARITANGVVLRNIVRDEEGRPLSITDALNRTTQFARSCQGLLSSVTDPLGQTTGNTYNGMGNLVSATDTANRTSSYVYDAAQRPTGRTDPAGQTTLYGYNADGQQTSLLDPLGLATTYAFSGTLAQTGETRPEGAILYTYDANQRLTRVDDNRGGGSKVTTAAYDSIGRIASITHPGGRGVAYGYNGRGQRTSMTAPDGTITTYQYDNAGRLSRLATGADNVQYTFDTGGRVAEALASNGVRSTYTYDSRSRLVSMVVRNAANTTLASFAYTRNNLGAATARVATDGSSSYSYDSLNRLTGDGATGYSYDPAGNRTSGGATFSQDHRLTSDGVNSYTYDNAGRTKTRGSQAFGYDSQNMLTSYSGPGSTAAYAYDFLNRRVARTVNGVAAEYLFDGPNLLAEYRSGLLAALFTFAPGMDRPVMQRRGAAVYFYHLDPNGNVALITDAAGAVVHRYSYSAFGVITSSTGSFAYSGAGLVNTFTFQGREYDEESGLLAFRARYYDAASGRFLTKDPLLGELHDPRSLHPYAFALNDPVNAKDPTGKVAAIEYGTLISAPGIQEATGALIGFLQGFALPHIQFLGEFLSLDPSLDLATRWDLSMASTQRYIDGIEELVGYSDHYADTPGFVGAWAGGASFEIGLDLSLNAGPFTYGYDEFKFDTSVGGWAEGGKNAIKHLGSLRPH